MQFVSAKDGDAVEGASQAAQDDDPMNKLKGQKIVQCRVCKGDHWTTKCPYKEKLAPIDEKLTEAELESSAKEGTPSGASAPKSAPAPAGGGAPGKYVPPSLRAKEKGGS